MPLVQQPQPGVLAWVLRESLRLCYHLTMGFQRARGWLAAIVLAAISLIALRYEHDVQYRMLHTGDRLRPLRLSSLSGNGYTLNGGRHPLLINVFATWCGPCREETPGLVAAASALSARGIRLVGIDQQESAQAVQTFARDFHVPYPLYVDDVGLTHTVLGARVIPTTIYVDGSGIIRWEHAGPITAQTLRSIADE
jgi:thiol-disulfide isomerase/thioredoxin